MQKFGDIYETWTQQFLFRFISFYSFRILFVKWIIWKEIKNVIMFRKDIWIEEYFEFIRHGLNLDSKLS